MGGKNLSQLCLKIIFNYDSTGIQVQLQLILLYVYENVEDNINDQFFKYKFLIKLNLFLIGDLVNHLNRFWDNIDEWWLSKTLKRISKNLMRISIFMEISALYLNLKNLLEKNEKNVF